MDSYLDKIVQCPKCHKDVRDGDRIWLDGECLCPDCYKHKRQSYDDMYKKVIMMLKINIKNIWRNKNVC